MNTHTFYRVSWHLWPSLRLLLVVAFVAPFFALQAQQTVNVKYDFSDIVANMVTYIDPTPPPVQEGMRFYPIVAVPDESLSIMATTTSAKEAFSYKGWPLAEAGKPVGNVPNQYYECRLEVLPGRVFYLERIGFRVGRSASGIRHYTVRSSLDDFAANMNLDYNGVGPVTILSGNVYEIEDVSTDGYVGHYVRVDDTIRQSLIVRFYGWDAETLQGTFRLDDLQIEGLLYDTTSSTEHETETIIGSAHQTFEHKPYDVMLNQFVYHGQAGEQIINHTIQQERFHVDAAIHIFNPNDSLVLQMDSLSLSIYDETNQECSDYFQIQVSFPQEIPARNEEVVKIRLVPNFHPSTETHYRVEGRLSYFEPTADSLWHGLLYPMPFTVTPMARPVLRYFLPETASFPLAWRIDNSSMVDSLRFQMNLQSGLLDTSVTRSLAPKASCMDMHFLPDDSVSLRQVLSELRTLEGCSLDTNLMSEARFYSLYKDVRLYGANSDERVDFLVASSFETMCPDSVFGSQSEAFEVLKADSLYTDQFYWSRKDSVVRYTLQTSRIGWYYADCQLPFDPALIELLSVHRAVDSLSLPLSNVWTTPDSCLHVFAYSEQGESEDYLLSYRYRIPYVPYYTYLNDSICLGDGYEGYGFELPEQLLSGDFVFSDTLTAYDGADSIVFLSLNVCERPAAPEQIYGDSILVRAGNYVYSISPVPHAAFYVWSILPQSWPMEVEGAGEQIALNIPYAGSGSLSVRAVNRCGSSDPVEKQLQWTDGLPTNELGGFKVYPEGDGFRLETNGIRGKTYIAISDMSGRLLHTEAYDIDSDTHVFHFSLQQFSAGSYLISLVNRNHQQIEKIVAQ